MNLLDRTTLLGSPDISRSTFNDYIQLFILVILICKFLSQQTNLRGWIISFIVIIVGFFSWRMSKEGWLFWLVLFVMCSQGVDLKLLAGLTFVITCVLTVVVMACSALGVTPNLSSMRDGVLRYTMGFTHPNFLGLYLLLICVSFTSFKFGKKIIPDIALVSITTAVNLIVADSRSSAVLAALLVVMLFAFRFARGAHTQRVLSWICFVVVLAAVVSSYYFMIAYDPANPVDAALDSALSGRLHLQNGYFKMQPLTPFGSDFSQFEPIYWEDGRPYEFVVDNAFCHLLLRYGIVPTVFFMAGLFALLAKLLHERRCGVLLFGITLMMVYGMTETLGIRVECDFFLVAMGSELLFGGSEAVTERPAEVRYRRPSGLEVAQ